MGISYSGGANWTYIYFFEKKFGHIYILVNNWKMEHVFILFISLSMRNKYVYRYTQCISEINKSYKYFTHILF